MKRIIQMGFANGSTDTVIVATMDGYWDALSASALAGLNGCPVLLTDGRALSDETASEIVRLGSEHVYVAGGDAAVSKKVVSEIEALSTKPVVTRLAGDIAIKTALDIYHEGTGKWNDVAIVAASETFQDALSISPYAYWAHAPIFLANATTHKLDDYVLDELKAGGFSKIVIVGGPAAISLDVEKQIGSIETVRLYGETCYETSAAIADWCIDEGMTASGVGVATGTAYYDALTGAALCGKSGAPILLAADDRTGALGSFVEKNASEIEIGFVFGGTAAISEYVFDFIGSALGY